MTGGRVLLVGDEDSRGALAAARSFGRAGWTVGIATPARKGLLPACRFARERHVIAPPGDDLDGWAAQLARTVGTTRYDVVFGTGDEWVLALAAGADIVPGVVAHAPYEALRRAFDKLQLTRAADAAGLHPPRTVELDAAALRGWAGPLIVKQRVHVSPAASVASRVETKLFADRFEASAWCDALLADGRPAVLQDVVSGSLVAMTALTAADGGLVAVSQQVASHVWPAPAGVSALAQTVVPAPALVEKVLELLRALGITGLAQVQLLHDDSSGELRCIDVNPRYYGSLALAIRAGVDFPVLWAEQALGRGAVAATPLTARAGVRYQWLEGDLRRALGQPASIRRRAVLDAVRAAPRAVHATPARDDLRPSFAHALALAQRAAVKARG